MVIFAFCSFANLYVNRGEYVGDIHISNLSGRPHSLHGHATATGHNPVLGEFPTCVGGSCSSAH